MTGASDKGTWVRLLSVPIEGRVVRGFEGADVGDEIRVLHYNLKVAKAWHKAVLANSPFAYKTFHENYSNSLYAPAADRRASDGRAPRRAVACRRGHSARRTRTPR